MSEQEQGFAATPDQLARHQANVQPVIDGVNKAVDASEAEFPWGSCGPLIALLAPVVPFVHSSLTDALRGNAEAMSKRAGDIQKACQEYQNADANSGC